MSTGVQAGGINDNGPFIEEPDDKKLSSPVLKASGEPRDSSLSQLKRAASSVLGRALLDLDLGAVMGEGGGLIGSAELSIKRALQIATTTKCVLGLGEYEKAVGGMRSSARTDGGATSRVVGSLLNWLAEPHPGVFVIATANDVRELAPEQIREGASRPSSSTCCRPRIAPKSSQCTCASGSGARVSSTCPFCQTVRQIPRVPRSKLP